MSLLYYAWVSSAVLVVFNFICVLKCLVQGKFKPSYIGIAREHLFIMIAAIILEVSLFLAILQSPIANQIGMLQAVYGMLILFNVSAFNHFKNDRIRGRIV